MAEEKPTSVCKQCQIEKPIADYRIKRGLPLGRCRSCENDHQRSYRLENRDKLNEAAREKYSLNREAELAKTKAWQAANHEKVKAAASAWRAANRDYAKRANLQWRTSNPDYYQKRHAEKYYANPESARQRVKDWYHRNRERHLQRLRERRLANLDARRVADREKYAKNPEGNLERSRRWRSNNLQKFKALSRVYRSRRSGVQGRHTPNDIWLLLEVQGNRCASCAVRFRGDNYTVDHVMPIARGGTNWADNLQLLCARCNSRKNARHPDDWAREIGKLFI